MVKKLFFIAIIFFTAITGCKPTRVAFAPADINTDYVKNIIGLTKKDTCCQITGGKIFVANLYDNFVNRDGIAEKTISNEKSTKEKLDLPLHDKTYQLFIITTEGSGENEAVFLPSVFESKGKCIGLGPAMIGKFGPGELIFFKKAKFYSKKQHGKTGWVYDKKASEFKNGSVFDPNDPSKTKFNVLFQTNEMEDIIDLRHFQITNILRLNDNRFGGNKPLIYNIASVFEDPEALYFTFLRNL